MWSLLLLTCGCSLEICPFALVGKFHEHVSICLSGLTVYLSLSVGCPESERPVFMKILRDLVWAARSALSRDSKCFDSLSYAALPGPASALVSSLS